MGAAAPRARIGQRGARAEAEGQGDRQLAGRTGRDHGERPDRGAARAASRRFADAVHRVGPCAARRDDGRTGRGEGGRREGAGGEVRPLLALRAAHTDRAGMGRHLRSVRRSAGRTGEPLNVTPRTTQVWIAGVIVILDQAVKLLVRSRLTLYESITVIPGLLD